MAWGLLKISSGVLMFRVHRFPAGDRGGLLNLRWRPGNFAIVGHHGCADDDVFRVDFDFPVIGHVVEEVEKVCPIEFTGLCGNGAGEVSQADDGDAVPLDDFVRFGEGTVPTLGCREVNDDRSVTHGFHHSRSDQLRGWFARNEGSGDDDIDIHGLPGKEFHFGIDELLAHGLGVAAFPCAILFKIEHEELPTKALYLVCHGRAGVKCADDCPEGTGRPNGGQPGYPSPDHEHLGRGDFTRGCNLPGKETSEMVGRLNDRPIAGDIGHRAECVHLLRPSDPRDAVHGEGGHLLFGQSFDQCFVLGGPDEADED